MVTRLTHQKGIDFLTEAADAIIAMGWQVAVVGTGERDLVSRLEGAQRRHRDHFAVFIGFDESLAHLVEAGSDVFLMPSRFEPCGMNQMYSQRYGTPPIVNATGGLVDTVTEDRHQTGFVMAEASTAQLIAACRRAIDAMKDAKRWRQIQLNGMERDFSWGPAAKKYQEIYKSIVTPA
jgi:starch synthase